MMKTCGPSTNEASPDTPLYFILLVLVGVGGLLLTAGCSEAVIRQYTQLGQWSQPSDSPTVLSGSPGKDTIAHQASEELLSEADWEILEKIAPRPIWERIDSARKRLGKGKALVRAPKKQPGNQPPPIPTNVPITVRPDGKLRIVYTFRHAGGPLAKSTLDGGTQRRKISLTPVDLKPMVEVINKQLGEAGTCSQLPSENALVITCDAGAKDTVLQLLADVDRPTKQVEIAARIFEVRHDFDFQLGAQTLLQHMASDGTQSLASNFSTRSFLDSLSNVALGDFAFQGSALRLMQTFGDSGLTIDATFQALVDTGLVHEVASPRMTVQLGRTGSMLAGQELPITSARISNDNLVTEKTTYKPVGVQLYITPQAIGDQQVKLHVLTIVSAVAGFNPRMSLEGSDSLNSLVNPIFDSREAETSVTVADGSTLVIGGLRTVRHITRERKIPGLGDIKGLEWLFKNHRSQRHLSDLYFFITPRVIQ